MQSVSDNFKQSLDASLGFLHFWKCNPILGYMGITIHLYMWISLTYLERLQNVCLLPDCRNGKRGQGWERKYVVLEGNKVLTYETEPREGHYFLN